jgi:hypothetical protein
MRTETSSAFEGFSTMINRPPHASIPRFGLALALAMTLSAASILVGGASNARADACTGGPVAIGIEQVVPLERSMRLTVFATCDSTSYDATASGYLYVAGHRTGRLQAFKLIGVQTTPTTKTITIPDTVLSATRAYARRGDHHYRYATLKFVVAVTDSSTGVRYPYDYSTYSRLRV